MIDDAEPGTEPIADKFVNDVRAATRNRLKASRTINQGLHKKPLPG